MPAPDGAARRGGAVVRLRQRRPARPVASAEPAARACGATPRRAVERRDRVGADGAPPSAGAVSRRAGSRSPISIGTATSDIVMLTAGGVGVLLNDGDPDRRAQRVQLKGRVSNRLGHRRQGAAPRGKPQHARRDVGGHADGGARRRRVRPGQPAGADAVRVLWPSGILQSETTPVGRTRRTCPPAAPAPPALVIEELDRKPSSCPFLFTWNGERFEFVTDFLGAGEMGYWEAPGVRNAPDPDGVRADPRRPASGRATGAWNCASRTSSRRRCSSIASAAAGDRSSARRRGLSERRDDVAAEGRSGCSRSPINGRRRRSTMTAAT